MYIPPPSYGQSIKWRKTINGMDGNNPGGNFSGGNFPRTVKNTPWPDLQTLLVETISHYVFD